MSSKYEKYNWTIIEVSVKKNQNRSYRLVLNGGKKVEKFIMDMREKFYEEKFKKVPVEILNGSHDIKNSFFEGYYAGDGFRTQRERKNTMGFDILGQVGAQGLCFIAEQLGYSTTVKCKKDRNDVYTVYLTKRFKSKYLRDYATHQKYFCRNPGEVFEISTIGTTDDVVYDIETENHHLNVGVGGLVVHNCDGAHICALVINMIHYLFPHILRDCPTFLQRFATPIVKVWNQQGVEKSFFSISEKNSWQNSLEKSSEHGGPARWKERYYKGLGTSTNREAKLYFSRLNDHIIDLRYDGDETDEILKIMFAKSESDTRKIFLENNYNPNASVDYTQSVISVKDYILQEVLHFSWEDNVRSIPHVVDGLKPSERKILYTCLAKNVVSDVKVSELSGIASAFTHYHHGEISLQSTIIGMAQNHVGSNNINLLVPQGQHGSRLNKSSEHASARYLFTRTFLDHQKNISPSRHARVELHRGRGKSYGTCLFCSGDSDVGGEWRRWHRYRLVHFHTRSQSLSKS